MNYNIFMVVPAIIALSNLFATINQKQDVVINDSLTVVAKSIYTENFEGKLSNWKVEQQEGGQVSIIEGKLDIESTRGTTVWLTKPMNAPIMIEYDVTVIQSGGPNDRVSDLNCFWLAKDPAHPNDFFKNSDARAGTFGKYDPLALYYVGLGGHNNTKTRFRKYDGKGNKPLLPEHDLSEEQFLIVPNKLNQIKIIVFQGIVQYFRNEQLIFEFIDEDPYRSGYFGFRTVRNHMKIDNFVVSTLKEHSTTK